MEEYQKRVVAEKEELDGRLMKLINFSSAETYWKLNSAERERLRRQTLIMMNYSTVLGERIEAFIK